MTKGNLPIASIELAPNEKIYADSGCMVYMTGNTVMQAKARGGFLKSLARSFAGENVFLTEFTTTGGSGIVAVAGPVPGTMIAKEIVPGRAIFAQKGAFLAADNTVNMEIAFQKSSGRVSSEERAPSSRSSLGRAPCSSMPRASSSR